KNSGGKGGRPTDGAVVPSRWGRPARRSPLSGRAFSSLAVRTLNRETSSAARVFFSQGINACAVCRFALVSRAKPQAAVLALVEEAHPKAEDLLSVVRALDTGKAEI